MIRRAATALLVLTAIFATAPACGQQPDGDADQALPEFTNYVVDVAGVVPDDVEKKINTELEAYEDRSGAQIAVAVIDSTGDESLEDYTIDLAKEWGVGSAEEDNGVLLLIAIEDRKLRIEVGEGIEGELTDLESGRIDREKMRPLLREGDYGEAVLVGTREIRRAIDGDTAAPIAQPTEDQPEEGRRVPGGGLWGLAPIFFLPFIFGARRRRRSPVFWGGGTVDRNTQRDRRRRESRRGDDDDDGDSSGWLGAAILGGLLLGGGRRSGGWGGNGGDFGGGFGGGGGGDFGGGGASGDW